LLDSTALTGYEQINASSYNVSSSTYRLLFDRTGVRIEFSNQILTSHAKDDVFDLRDFFEHTTCNSTLAPKLNDAIDEQIVASVLDANCQGTIKHHCISALVTQVSLQVALQQEPNLVSPP
jgi:hypothetical protein